MKCFEEMPMMELQEFVEKALTEINSAVKASIDSGIEVPQIFGGSTVEFDVAVTFSESTSKEGKGGIKVYNIGAEGGASSTSSKESVTRLKFTLPIRYPFTQLPPSPPVEPRSPIANMRL
jgi:hypothetical protein